MNKRVRCEAKTAELKIEDFDELVGDVFQLEEIQLDGIVETGDATLCSVDRQVNSGLSVRQPFSLLFSSEKGFDSFASGKIARFSHPTLGKQDFFATAVVAQKPDESLGVMLEVIFN